ncbi:MAG: class I SAM-dependent methyltransferase [Actinomycetota bacterium]
MISTAAIDIETPDWQIAGRAWDHAAADWATLFEPYARDAIETILATTGVGPGTSLLDLACGSGVALGRAERLGARTAGIDAAAGLLEIAGRRAPSAELVWGSMFDLPWADASFDVVTSFNGIWGGCDEAIAEAARVLRPGGRLAFTFWGPGKHLDLRDFFIAVGTSTPEVGEELIALAQIAEPGVAEAMVEAAGLRVDERGTSTAIGEWPDADTAWRALRSPGVVLPSLEHTGEDELRRRVLDAVAPFRAADGSYLVRNQLVHVVATKPAS